MDTSSLQYFVGKVCSIMTISTQRTYTEQQWMDYFVGIVEAVNGFGIFTTHAVTGNKNFYKLEHIVSIHEEQCIKPGDQLYDELLEKRKEKIKQVKPTNQFVDIDKLTKLSNPT